MTIRKLLLTLSIVLSCGLIVGGIVSAQEAPKAPKAPKSQKAPKAELAENDFDFDFKFDDFDFKFDDKFDWQDDRSFTLFLQGGTFLGVHAEDVTKENMSRYGMREVRGVGVSEIVKDSPAEKAGLRKDDVILAFNGEAVTSTRKLTRLVSESSADQNVRLTISRGGSEQEVTATLSKRQGTGMLNTKIREDMKERMEKLRKDMKIRSTDGTWVINMGSHRRMGIGTQTLTKQLADYFGVTEGVLVTSVNDNSPAAKAGLKAGDVITAVDGEKVASSGDISRAIGKKQDGPVTLTVVRDRNTRSVIVTPEKPAPGSGADIRTIVTPDIRTIVTPDIRTIVTPQITIPVIPAITIQTPQITVPVIPPVEVTIPVRSRTRVII